MSWDVILFNSKQKINSIEEIDEEMFVPIDFCEVLNNYFDKITQNDNHREIKGKDFSIYYFIDSELVSNKLFQFMVRMHFMN